MLDRFQALIEELGSEVDLALQLTPQRTLAIRTTGNLVIQLEESSDGHRVLLASKIAPLPAGKFREEVLLSALQFNSIHPRIGTLGYFEGSGELILFQWIPFTLLTGVKLADIIELFVHLAETWHKLIQAGGTGKWVAFEAQEFLRRRWQPWMVG